MDYIIGSMVMGWSMVSPFKTAQQNIEIDMYERKEGQAELQSDKTYGGHIGTIDFDNPLGTDKDTANTDLVYHNGNYLRCGG